jgi:hypothetical protein
MPGLEAALRSGLERLIVSVSGLDQEVYQINHKAGNIEYVKDNLRRAAALKASGVTTTQIALRFLKFSYNHDQEGKLRSFAGELGIDFEVLDAAGDPLRQIPVVETNRDFEDRLRSYRSERPHDQPGKVCPLIFGAGASIDCNGDAYLCCAYPNYDALKIGAYLDLPQEEILLRKYNHPMCASCGFPRRDATAADKQALLEALHYRLGMSGEVTVQPPPASRSQVRSELLPLVFRDGGSQGFDHEPTQDK